MATRKNRKNEGGNLRRSEVMTMRFDPRTRYLMELAARVQRRTVSSFVDWAVTEALKGIDIGITRVPVPLTAQERLLSRTLFEPERRFTTEPVKLLDAAVDLWDPNEADRFVLLARAYPELLNYDESLLWKVIEQCPAVWDDKQRLNVKLLREHWDTLKAVAAGTADPSTLLTLISEGRGNG